MNTNEKTYSELFDEQKARWATIQDQRQKELTELHGQLSKMPDVANAPKPDEPWNDCGIFCFDCMKETRFFVSRWVTLNGVRHRAELKCSTCNKTATYDFDDQKWLVG